MKIKVQRHVLLYMFVKGNLMPSTLNYFQVYKRIQNRASKITFLYPPPHCLKLPVSSHKSDNKAKGSFVSHYKWLHSTPKEDL